MTDESPVIEADVYLKDTGRKRYYVRMSFPELGMYINSFTVQPSKYPEQPYWVQEPKYLNGRAWRSHVEFEKRSELGIWQRIEAKAREAVEAYEAEAAALPSSDGDEVYMPSDAELEDTETLLSAAIDTLDGS